MKRLWEKYKHKLVKWIWKDNGWIKAIDDVEKAVESIRSGREESATLQWRFAFMGEPNTFDIKVTQALKVNEDLKDN